MARVADLKTRDAEYWEKRFATQAEKAYAKGDRTLKELKGLFGLATREIDTEVGSFYAKYGVMMDSPVFTTLADGSKVVSGTSKKLVVPNNVANAKLSKGTRISRLEGTLRGILMQLSKDQNDYMKTTLGSIATDGYYDTIFTVYKGYSVGSSFNLLDPKLVNQLINNPVNGQAFSARVWSNRDRLANTVNQTLRSGLIQGVSNGEMSKRLAKNMNSGYKAAERLIQTEVTNAYNQATLAGYEASGIVKQYEYLATLDQSTSDICSELDGQIFNMADATVGLNYPPMHPNCRSTTVAHFDDSKEGLTRMARSLGGDTFTVPADMTVKDFKSIYVDKTMSRADWDNKR